MSKLVSELNQMAKAAQETNDGQEEIKDKPEETPKQEVKYSDFHIASPKSIQEKFGVLKEGRQVVIPIDLERKTAIFLKIKDLSVSESLALVEKISTIDEDTGLPMILFQQYYKICWTTLVISSQPPLAWKNVKQYNEKFLQVMMKEMPSIKSVLGIEIDKKDKKKSRRS